jgi:hypothetical protein
MNDLEKEFYNEIKDALNDYVDSFGRAASNKNEDLAWSSCEESYKLIQNSNLTPQQVNAIKEISKEICIGVLHSTFVSIDGGTALSNEGKALELVDRKTGKPLTEGALHENFMEVFD